MNIAGFTKEDITHKSKRFQGQSIIEQTKDISLTNPVVNVPVALTLESAVQFFESNAKGSVESLYKFTARSLRDFIALKGQNARSLRDFIALKGQKKV